MVEEVVPARAVIPTRPIVAVAFTVSQPEAFFQTATNTIFDPYDPGAATQ